MKKILFVANVHQHFLDCHIPYIQWLQEQGHIVHVAAGGFIHIPFVNKQFTFSVQRSPFSFKNIKACFELKNIIRENTYDLIHCHTPMGGVMARLAAKEFRKKGLLKVLYTAHGFYFYKGAPLSYWLFYFPTEKFLSRFTDGLITINKEDDDNVRRLKFHSTEKFKINGIGINNHKFKPLPDVEKSQVRTALNYTDDQFIIIYVAEFIHRKNHRFIIDALPLLVREIKTLKIIFAGTGKLKSEIQAYAAQKGLRKFIDFPGFRTDIEKFMGISDVGISSSHLEGLPMNIAEEQFCGIPVVVSKIRGHTDLVVHNENGYIFEEGNQREFAQYIIDLYRSPEKSKQMGEKGLKSVQPFGIDSVMESMAAIYQKYLS